MDIDMAKLRLDAISVTLDKSYSLRIATPEGLSGTKREAGVAAEAILVLRFNASS